MAHVLYLRKDYSRRNEDNDKGTDPWLNSSAGIKGFTTKSDKCYFSKPKQIAT